MTDLISRPDGATTIASAVDPTTDPADLVPEQLFTNLARSLSFRSRCGISSEDYKVSVETLFADLTNLGWSIEPAKPSEAATKIIDATNGKIQVSKSGRFGAGLIVERGNLSAGVILTRDQAKEVAMALLAGKPPAMPAKATSEMMDRGKAVYTFYNSRDFVSTEPAVIVAEIYRAMEAGK